ncbi:MAG: hypothetical protein WDM86_11095 [Rhizomicrobium sp.]
MLIDAMKNVWWQRIADQSGLTTACNFETYRQISKVTSEPATHILIWTLYGSPLNVPQRGGWPLTPQDRFFRDQISRKKIRVAIFSNPRQARRYANICDAIKSGRPIRRLDAGLKNRSDVRERVIQFETACNASGKLYYSSTDLIAKVIPHHFKKLSVAFVADDAAQTYCISSSFAASRQGGAEDIRDVSFFALSDGDHPHADGRRHYYMLLSQLLGGEGSWYSDNPRDIANRTGGWLRHIITFPLQYIGSLWHRYLTVIRENKGVERVLKLGGLVVFQLFVVVSIIGFLVRFASVAQKVDQVCQRLFGT